MGVVKFVPLRDGLEAFMHMLRSRPLQFEVLGHPESVNRIWRHGNGRIYKTAKASTWEALTMLAAKREAHKIYGTSKLEIMRGFPLRLEMDFIRDTWRQKRKSHSHLVVRPDVSNLIKVAEDALMRGLDLDDSAVVELVVKKVELAKSGPRVAMRLFFLPHMPPSIDH